MTKARAVSSKGPAAPSQSFSTQCGDSSHGQRQEEGPSVGRSNPASLANSHKVRKIKKDEKENKRPPRPCGWRVSSSPSDGPPPCPTAACTGRSGMPDVPPEPPGPKRSVPDDERRRYALGQPSIPRLLGEEWERRTRSVIGDARGQARGQARLSERPAGLAARAAESAGSAPTNRGGGTPARTAQAQQSQESTGRRGGQTPERAGVYTVPRSSQAASPTRDSHQRGSDRASGAYNDVVRAARERVAAVHRQTVGLLAAAAAAAAATTSDTVTNEASPARSPSSTGVDRNVGQQSATTVSPHEFGAASEPRAPPNTPRTPPNRRRGGTRGIARPLPAHLRSNPRPEPQKPSERDLRAAARAIARAATEVERPDTPTPNSKPAGRTAESRESSRRSQVPVAEDSGYGRSSGTAERIRPPPLSGRRNIGRGDILGERYYSATSVESGNRQKMASQSRSQSQSQSSSQSQKPRNTVAHDLQEERARTRAAARRSSGSRTQTSNRQQRESSGRRRRAGSSSSPEPPSTDDSQESDRPRRKKTPQNPARQRDEPDVRYLWPASAPPPPMWMHPKTLRDLGEAGISEQQKDQVDLAYDPDTTAWIDRHYRTGHRQNGLFEDTGAASPRATTRSRLLAAVGHTGDSERLRADRERTRRAHNTLSKADQLTLWIEYEERLTAVENGHSPVPGQTLMTREELNDWWEDLDPTETLTSDSAPSSTSDEPSSLGHPHTHPYPHLHPHPHPNRASADRQLRGRSQGGQETPDRQGFRRARSAAAATATAAAVEASTDPGMRRTHNRDDDHLSTEQDRTRTRRVTTTTTNPAGGASYEDSISEFLAEGNTDPWRIARDPAERRDS